MSRLVYHDTAERERMYDVLARMRLPFGIALGVLIVPAIAAGPVYGWACEIPLVAAVLAYGATEARMRSLRRPERWVIGTWAFAELMILLTIALADGPREYLLAVPMVPMVGVMMMAGRRIALMCASCLALALCAVAALTMWDEVTALPPVLIAPVALIFAGVFTAMGALEGGFVSRRTAAIDPLTGLLNRVALQTRTTELAAQARIAGERVALVVVELDRYHEICDEYGAETGDAVLAEVARRLRTQAGAGTVSRFDGATFVVLYPGVTGVSAVAAAERLRVAVASTPIDDVEVTASVGIAVYRGEAFDFAELFARGAAAAAVVRDRGGDRVGLAPHETGAPLLAAVPRGELPAAAYIPPDAAWRERLRTATGRSPLMPNAIARAHAVDALARTRPLIGVSALALGVAFAALGFWTSWLVLVPAMVGALIWEVLVRRAPRARRPEYVAFAGLALIIVACGLSAVAAGAAGLFMVPAVAVIVLGACSGFPRAGAALLGAIGFVTTAAVVVAVGGGEIAANPVILALPLTCVVGFAVMGETMGRTAREHRVASITDPRTGMLNHAALDARIPALEQLAVDRAITLAVLEFEDGAEADAAARIRDAVHPFIPVYRIGDGEFVVLFADMDETASTRLAERLAETVPGCTVGVASVPAGDVCSFDVLFAEATAAEPGRAQRRAALTA